MSQEFPSGGGEVIVAWLRSVLMLPQIRQLSPAPVDMNPTPILVKSLFRVHFVVFSTFYTT